jgi:hypothetical protein
MKLMKLITFSAIVFMLAVGTASAQRGDIERGNSQTGKMMHKLGRGIVNVLTCWVEIPKTMASEWEEKDPVSGTVTGIVSVPSPGRLRGADGSGIHRHRYMGGVDPLYHGHGIDGRRPADVDAHLYAEHRLLSAARSSPRTHAGLANSTWQ